MLHLLYELMYRRFAMPWETEPPGKELVNLIESGRVESGRAIDLGGGTGRNAIYLAQRAYMYPGFGRRRLVRRCCRAGAMNT